MASTTYPIPSTGLYFPGDWFSSVQGRPAWVAWMAYSEMDFTFVGTAFSLVYYATQASTIRLTIDGVTTTPTLTLNTWTTQALATGLADTSHVVKIKAVVGPNLWLDVAGAVIVTGAAPSLTAQPSLAAQTQIYTSAPAPAAGIALEGGWNVISNTNGQQQAQAVFTDPMIRFFATTNTINAFVADIGTGGTHVRLYVDGVAGAVVSTPGLGSNNYELITFTGLDGGGQHLYELTFSDDNPTSAIFSILLPTGAINTSPSFPARTKVAAFYGDSITQGQVGTGNDSSLGWARLLCVAKNWLCFTRAKNGTSVSSTYSGATSGQSRTADITGLSPAPDVCLILYGTNDLGIGAVPVGTFQTAYQAMMNTLCTALPSCRFYCIDILPRGDKTQAQVDTFNAAITAAIGALTVTQQAQIAQVHTKAWNFGGAAYTTGGAFSQSPNFLGDNLHPGVTGNATIEQLLFGLFNPMRGRNLSGAGQLLLGGVNG